MYSPSGFVSAYLDAVVAEDWATVAELSDLEVPEHNALLLSDAIAGTLDSGVRSYSIDDERVEDDRAVVNVTLQRDGESRSLTYYLAKTGSGFIFLDEWGLSMDSPQRPPLETITLSWPEHVDAVEINGVQVDLSGYPDREVVLAAYPGSYRVTPVVGGEFVDGEFFAPQEEWLVVPVPAPGVITSQGVALEAPVLEESIAQVQELVNAELDECARSTDPRPESCAFWVDPDAGPGTWEIDRYPLIEVTHRGDEIRIGTRRDGDAYFTPDQADPNSRAGGRVHSGTPVSGTATVADDGTVTIELNPGSTG